MGTVATIQSLVLIRVGWTGWTVWQIVSGGSRCQTPERPYSTLGMLLETQPMAAILGVDWAGHDQEVELAQQDRLQRGSIDSVCGPPGVDLGRWLGGHARTLPLQKDVRI